MIERQLAAQFALSGAHLGQAQLVQYPAFGVENSSQNMGRKGFAGAVLRVKGIAHVAIEHGGPKFEPGGSDKAHLQAQSGTACPQARGEGIGPIIISTAGDRQPVRCGEKDQYIAGKGTGQSDLFGAGVRGRHRLDDHWERSALALSAWEASGALPPSTPARVSRYSRAAVHSRHQTTGAACHRDCRTLHPKWRWFRAARTVWRQGFLSHANAINKWVGNTSIDWPKMIVGLSPGAAAARLLSKTWAVPATGIAAPRPRKSRGEIVLDELSLSICRYDDIVCFLPSAFHRMGQTRIWRHKAPKAGPNHDKDAYIDALDNRKPTLGI